MSCSCAAPSVRPSAAAVTQGARASGGGAHTGASHGTKPHVSAPAAGALAGAMEVPRTGFDRAAAEQSTRAAKALGESLAPGGKTTGPTSSEGLTPTVRKDKTGRVHIKYYYMPQTAQDPARAAQIMQQMQAALPKTADEARAAGYVQKDGGDHWNNPAYKGGVAGDPTKPEMLMVKDGKVTGAVFNMWLKFGEEAKLPDMGLGGWHFHQYNNGGRTFMKHVMFEDDLTGAFADGHKH